MKPTDEQLARWLENPSPEEIQELQEWLDQRPEHHQAWANYTALWRASAELGSSTSQPDKEKMWSGIQNEIGNRMPFKYAAAAVVLFTLSVSLWFSMTPAQESYLAQNGALEIWLADSSRVVLKEGAELTVSKAYSKERTVYLKGDAFFDVKRNEQKPFKVNSESHFVNVLGTSFLVSLSTPNQAKVSVFTGKVEFGLASGLSRVLTKDMSLTISGDRFLEQEKRANDLAWWTGLLQYGNAPLAEFVTDMRYNFGVEVPVNSPSLLNCTFTATFEGLSPDQMMQAVATIFEGDRCE